MNSMEIISRVSFIELEYTKQRKVFEEEILPVPQNDLFFWQVKLIQAIYSGNKELLQGLSELKPFFIQYCQEDRNIEYLNKKMSFS